MAETEFQKLSIREVSYDGRFPYDESTIISTSNDPLDEDVLRTTFEICMKPLKPMKVDL